MKALSESNTLKFGIPELDRKIGGIPIPSLTLVEGPNNSGKSVLVQQLTWSALNNNLKVLYITTEDTLKGLISHMERLNWKVTDFFIRGDFKITTLHVRGIKWNSDISRFFLAVLMGYLERNVKRYDVIIIDSLTYVITYAEERDILEFFSECRNIVDIEGKVFIVTLHPYAVSRELFVRIRSISDGHIILSIKEFQGRNVLVLNAAKLRGARRGRGDIVSFEVDPAIGIKILPISSTRV